MGSRLYHVYSGTPPLGALSEQVEMLPEKGIWPLTHLGWPKLMFFFSGGFRLNIGTAFSYEINEGDVALITGDQHLTCEKSTARNYHALVVHFDQARARKGSKADASYRVRWERYLGETFPSHLYIPEKGNRLLTELALSIRYEWERGGPLREAKICATAFSLTLRAAECAGLYEQVALCSDLDAVEGALNMAGNSEYKKLSVKRVARNCGVSSAFLERSLRKYLGISFSQYVRRRTIDRAKSMLLFSSKSVIQIAKELSFNSAFAFRRSFQAMTLFTPKQYQRRYDGTPLQWRDSFLEQGEGGGKTMCNIRASYRVVRTQRSIALGSDSLVFCIQGGATIESGGRTEHLSESSSYGVFCGRHGALKTCAPKNSSFGCFVVVISGRDECISGASRVHKKEIPNRLERLWRTVATGFVAYQLELLRAWVLSGRKDDHAKLSISCACSFLWLEALQSTLPEIAPAVQENVPSSRHMLLMNRARDYLGKNASERLTLDHVAYAMGVSAEHLAREFKAATGKTVMGYLQEARVYRAQSLLVKTSLSLGEISLQAGFATMSHFYRTFRKHVGRTPAKFRKMGIEALP